MAVHPTTLEPASAEPAKRRSVLARYLAVLGPGLIVAFADTEAGSITTAATSGAQFGMKLVLLQILLIVPLFVVQEMTVRLGIVTKKGHAQLIREHYGMGWAWVSLGTMLVTNLAALVTEFIGIAGAALIFGVNPTLLVLTAAAVIIAVSLGGAYKRAEIAALGLCLLELLFIPAAFAAHPDPMLLVREGLFGSQPLGDRAYLLLVAGNIGAVIMPWMIFYQQSAVVDKGLRLRDLAFARLDTVFGAVMTQIIMIAVVVTTAATLFVRGISVSDAAHAALALEPLIGHLAGIIFGAALIGAALLGAFVVSLATAWAFGEAFQWRCSLNYGCFDAKRFYGFFVVCVLAAAGITLIPGLPLVRVTVLVMAFNALVLPIVLGFLLIMANDRNILGKRVNSPLGNAIALGVSFVCVALGLWYGFLTLSGQAG